MPHHGNTTRFLIGRGVAPSLPFGECYTKNRTKLRFLPVPYFSPSPLAHLTQHFSTWAFRIGIYGPSARIGRNPLDSPHPTFPTRVRHHGRTRRLRSDNVATCRSTSKTARPRPHPVGPTLTTTSTTPRSNPGTPNGPLGDTTSRTRPPMEILINPPMPPSGVTRLSPLPGADAPGPRLML